jgi:hypothetical protein
MELQVSGNSSTIVSNLPPDSKVGQAPDSKVVPNNPSTKYPSTKDYINTCDSCEPRENENLNNVSKLKQKKIDYEKIKDQFHDICTTLPQIIEMTDARKKTIRTLKRNNPNFDFEAFFKKVNDSDFLSGRNGKWEKCYFDWIFKPANRIKILEGNYDNKKSAVAQGGVWFDL